MSELITVKQLADKLSVPKSKVSYQSRKLDDSLIIQQNGTNYLTERAQLLITQAIRDLMNPPTAEDVKEAQEDVAETTEVTEEIKVTEDTEESEETDKSDLVSADDEDKLVNESSQEMMDLLYEWIDNLDDQIEIHQAQLDVYHDQLKAKDEQIDKLTQLLNQSQQLQLQQQKQQLQLVEDIEFEKSLTWWQKLFGK